ncbi:MAG: YtxH domain-containing protein [Smithella sp.]
MTTDNCMKGVILGGLAGAALGILCAPKSGKETRQQICRSSEEVFKKAKSQYEEIIKTIEKLAEAEKEMIVEQKGRMKNALEAGIEAYRREKQSSPSL